jgi:Flp pilus assembly protein TadB
MGYMPGSIRKSTRSVTKDASLPPPGWYPDPYQPGWQRWFDGTVWTTHATAADTPHPDMVVESGWQGSTPEELRELERHPGRDMAVHRGGERTYDGGRGWQGLYVNRVGRGMMRAGTRWGPVHATRWVGGVALALALLAWGDQRHRIVLAALAAIALVVTVIVGIREARDRAYWRDVGRTG